MKKIEWFFKNAGVIGAFWLGGAVTAFANLTFGTWQWWVIIIPTIIFFGIESGYWQYKNKNDSL